MLGAPNLSSSVEHTFLLGGWELFFFVWYPKKENAMSDNVAVGVCCVGTEILAKEGGGGCGEGENTIYYAFCVLNIFIGSSALTRKTHYSF